MAHDNFFDRIDAANARISTATTVEQIITICDELFPAEIAAGAAGDSFYPGGADEDLFSSLNLTYIEGDIYRGDHQ